MRRRSSSFTSGQVGTLAPKVARSHAPPSVRGVPCARMEGKDEHKDEGEAPLDAEVDEEPAIIDWPAALEQVIGCSPPLARARG